MTAGMPRAAASISLGNNLRPDPAAVERNEAPHVPVLLDKVLGGFEGRDVSVFVDGTLGAGGHARGILTQHPELKTFVGIDQDLTALALAKETLSRDASGTGSSPEVRARPCLCTAGLHRNCTPQRVPRTPRVHALCRSTSATATSGT